MLELSTIFYKWIVKYPSKDRKSDKGLGKDILNTLKQYFNVIENFKDIPSKPTIFVCNYCQDRVDNIVSITLPVKQSIVMRDILRHFIFGPIITNPIYLKGRNTYDYLREQIEKHHNQDRYVFAYIGKGKYNLNSTNVIGKLFDGVLKIAKSLDITVTPICIDHIEYDNIGRMNYQNFEIHIGKEMKITDIDTDRTFIRQFFKQNLIRFEKQKYIVD
jgi:hypothetical protein